jgi:branched-subunit amino acid transport protein
MAQPGVFVSERTPLFILIIDAIAFWLRSQVIFWLLALPIAGLAAAAAYAIGANEQFAFLRHPEGWDFLYALIYAMFIDRWIKESLLDDAAQCDEVDALRRAMVPPPLLLFAIVFFLFAMALSWLRLQGIEDTLLRWHLPYAVAAIAATVLSWLPHVLVWATVLGFFVLLIPAWCAGTPLSVTRAWKLSEPARPRLFRLVLGSTILSVIVYAATQWGLDTLPNKPWAAAAMAGAQRLADCLILAIAGHVLAALFQVLTDWHQPEPEERPFRHMRLRPPAASR